MNSRSAAPSGRQLPPHTHTHANARTHTRTRTHTHSRPPRATGSRWWLCARARGFRLRTFPRLHNEKARATLADLKLVAACHRLHPHSSGPLGPLLRHAGKRKQRTQHTRLGLLRPCAARAVDDGPRCRPCVPCAARQLPPRDGCPALGRARASPHWTGLPVAEVSGRWRRKPAGTACGSLGAWGRRACAECAAPARRVRQLDAFGARASH